MKKVLIVEDDMNLGTSLASILQMHQYSTRHTLTGKNIMDVLGEFKPDMILMDVMLGEAKDGFDLSREIRETEAVPIIFTTSRDGNDDFKAGFAIGNTDYIRKPYNVQEVLSRMELLLSKQSKDTSSMEIFRLGSFSFKPAERSLQSYSKEIHLSNYENAVLLVLCRHINTFVSRGFIIQSVWNDRDPNSKRDSLNNILTALRKHIRQDQSLQIESKIKLGIRLRKL